jgi:predicted Ser/Thr protein kinase
MNEPETDKKTPNKCPQCGVALPKGMLEGLCPACLLKQGAETRPPPGSVPFQPPGLEEVARLFPQLEILAFIGKGGMGAVYQARQPALDRMVALKILPPQATGSPGFAERFNREARALARLNHPNIVSVHEFGQAGGSPFFIMEFVDGLTLRQLEQAARLTPAEALRIVPQICEALQFAHDEGIVHRDIKPENILIDKKGRVKIADFGIAKIIGGEEAGEAVTDTRHAIGTPHYMAPEQMEKPQTVDHRADIFSLGVVFYEMLTGQLPLGRFAPPSRKAEIDARLDEVVLRALEREPELRYQHAADVKTQIDTIASTAPGKVPFPGVPVVNRRAFAWLSLGCLIVGLLGGPFLLAIHAEAGAAMTFGGLGLLLGLIFGMVSWRERLGRVITFVALGLMVLAVIGVSSCLVVFKLRSRARAVEAEAERSQMASRIPGASAETWAPTLAPGEKPDLQGIMSEAKNRMNQGHFDEALGRQIWFFNHAQEFDPGYAGVRLSFALSDWRELARRYPKALQALTEIRDRDTAEFAAGHGYAQLFQDALSINGQLDDPDATRRLCEIVADKNPRFAQQLYYFAAGPLVQQGEYALCSRFMGDPQTRFNFARSMKSQVDNFVGQVRTMVEILVGSGRKDEAKNITAQAIAVLDDPRLRSAVTDAEARIAKQNK